MRSLDLSRANKARRDCAHTRPQSTATVTCNTWTWTCTCSMKRVERVERAAATTGAAACRVLRVTRVAKSSQHRHDCECDAPVVTYQVWRQLCTRRQDLRWFSSLENVFTCLFSTATCVVVIDGAALVLVWITWHGKEGARARRRCWWQQTSEVAWKRREVSCETQLSS